MGVGGVIIMAALSLFMANTPSVQSILTCMIPVFRRLSTNMRTGAMEWCKRWFIKSGVTRLAQRNDALGQQPQEELRYDTEYARKQSFCFDLKIIIRQVWSVLIDMKKLGEQDE